MKLTSVALIFIFACSPKLVPVKAAPASQPASEPVIGPTPESELPLPNGLFSPLDPKKPNGDQIITRQHLDKLVMHTIHYRANEEKKIADLNARLQTKDSQLDVANAQAAQTAWQKTWVPILTGIGGAAFSAVVVTLVEWGLGALQSKAQGKAAQTANHQAPSGL